MVGTSPTETNEYQSTIEMIKEGWRPVAFKVDTSTVMPRTIELLMECEYGIVGSTDPRKGGIRQMPALQIQVDTICR